MKDHSKIIAKHLLDSSAIKLSPDNPFQWASGWNSPIYCDNRITLSFPDFRNDISQGLIDLIQNNFPEAEVIAGVATAGIPQASIIADRMKKPLIYVRPNPKSHGMKNQIEGRVEKEKKCVVIEDLISTGGSSLKAIEVLRNEGIEVLGLVAIFTYGFPIADQNFSDANTKYACLSNYESLLNEALDRGTIAKDQLAELNEWRQNPSIWRK